MATITLHVISNEYDTNAVAYLRGQLKGVALQYSDDLVLDVDLLKGANSLIGGCNNSDSNQSENFNTMFIETESLVNTFMRSHKDSILNQWIRMTG